MKLTADMLQNELIIITHHLDDIEIGLDEKDINYVKKGINDIREVVDRLSEFLTKTSASELDRISEFAERLDKALMEEIEQIINVGDRVRWQSEDNEMTGIKQGTIGTVTEIKNIGPMQAIRVKWEILSTDSLGRKIVSYKHTGNHPDDLEITQDKLKPGTIEKY